MSKLYIFDFDGTLADTTDTIVTAVQLMLKELGLPISTTDDIKKMIGLPLTECAAIATGSTDLDVINHAADTYRRVWPQAAGKGTKLFDGVYDTLHRLHDEGKIIAVATSRSRASVLSMLAETGLDRFVTTVRADDDVARKKPNPDMVLSIMDELSVDPTDTVTIGDTTFDIEMGAGAKTSTVGVAYGNHTRCMLQSAEPTYIIDDISELLSLRFHGE